MNAVANITQLTKYPEMSIIDVIIEKSWGIGCFLVNSEIFSLNKIHNYFG